MTRTARSRIFRSAVPACAVFTLVAGMTFAATPAFAASPLCDISANLDNDYEWMTSISLGTTQFEPELDANPYFDETTANTPLAAIAVAPGLTYDISVGVEASATDDNGDTWTEQAALWFDFNGDGQLQSDEKVNLGTSDTSTWDHADPSDPSSDVTHTFTGTVTIPASVASGKLWVRAMDFDHSSESSVPCDTADTVSGSAVDFQIQTPAASPSPSADLPNTGVGQGGIVLGFVGVALGLSLLSLTAWTRRRRS